MEKFKILNKGRFVMEQTKLTKWQIFIRIIFRLFLITVGACIYALGLDGFFPNSFMDGGITGISIMISGITGGSLSHFLILLNLPFLFFAYKLMGKKFSIFSLYGIIVLSIATALFRDILLFTDEMLLAAIFGGGCLGLVSVSSSATGQPWIVRRSSAFCLPA